jgi:hypothetical protein
LRDVSTESRDRAEVRAKFIDERSDSVPLLESETLSKDDLRKRLVNEDANAVRMSTISDDESDDDDDAMSGSNSPVWTGTGPAIASFDFPAECEGDLELKVRRPFVPPSYS